MLNLLEFKYEQQHPKKYIVYILLIADKTQNGIDLEFWNFKDNIKNIIQ